VLTYAAQNSAEIIVWISTEIRDEHRAAIDWLNKITKDEIGLFAVELRVITIDGSRPAPLLELRSSPNIWIKSESKLKPGPSPRDELYREFFQPLLDESREKHGFTNTRIAQPQSWYLFSSGTRGFNYSVEFSKGNPMRARVYIDTGDKDANKAAFDSLFASKNEVEAAAKWER
jgi:hypothetical protein